jgi:hypothetical protein
MKKTHSAWIGGSTAVIALAWLVVAPASAAAQRADRGGETVGNASPAAAAAPAPVASAPATSAPASAGPSSSGDGDSRSGRADRSGGRSGSSGGTAVRREGGTKSGGSQTGSNGSTVANGESGGRRARDGQNLGTAVPRGSVPIGTGGGVIFVPGGYGFYPWGYGGLGFGGYYGGYYDPWYYGGGGYPSYYPSQSQDDNGSLRLKVKPREASVYTDGYFAGHVDDFDGALQKLHLSAGPHRIEIRDPNYDTLTFDVRIQSDETITYRGDLTKIK